MAHNDDGSESRITFERSKEANSYTFVIKHEDHTLGNMLSEQLLSEPRVLYAGYRIEHPIKDLIRIRVKVNTPINRPSELIDESINTIVQNCNNLKNMFDQKAKEFSGGDQYMRR